MIMNVLCVIPARYASTRLPGKPLADIAGKPMIQRVYERASEATVPNAVLVATDHPLVEEAVKGFGGCVMMTSADHPTGTDRLAEVAKTYTDADVIINVQGDEPLIAPDVIDRLAMLFAEDETLRMATVITKLDERDAADPNAVKAVTDLAGNALYFSRSLIPYPRVVGKAPVYKHIGIYAYRRDFLLAYAKMAPTPLEQAESLEQLRALENGYTIRTIFTDHEFIGIDTREDLERINQLFLERKL